jgi:hypothetical protein
MDGQSNQQRSDATSVVLKIGDTVQLSLFEAKEPTCNADEAPSGFYAVPKDSLRTSDNICNHCDWRQQCGDEQTDLLAYGHRCMGYPIVAFRDGKTYQREDKCGVVFRRLPDSEKGPRK